MVRLHTLSKSLNKIQIRTNINLYIKDLPAELIQMRLSKIIRESTANKEAFQMKLNNSILANLINGLMQIITFLLGFFANTLSELFKNLLNTKNIQAINTNLDNIFNSLFILVSIYFVSLFAIHFLADFFNSKKLYYIEMYDYQIKYADCLKYELKLK